MIPSGLSAEVMAHQGWDALTIDMQHGYADYNATVSMLQAIATVPEVTPMVRVPWNEPGIIMRVLDAGAYGVICPMVSNREETERFVEACLYPPKGIRSFGPIRATMAYGSKYQETANDEVLKFAMIETKEALENLDEIMSTPGLDGIYIGPADLSLAIDEPPGVDYEYSSPTFKRIQQILERAKAHGIIAGLHCSNPTYAKDMIDRGFQLVTAGMDTDFLGKNAKQSVDVVKNRAARDTENR